MWSLRTMDDSREAKAPTFHPLFNFLVSPRLPICGTGRSGAQNLRAGSSEGFVVCLSLFKREYEQPCHHTTRYLGLFICCHGCRPGSPVGSHSCAAI